MLPGEVLVIGISQSRGEWVPWWDFSCCARVQEGEILFTMHIWLSLSSVCAAQVMEAALSFSLCAETPWARYLLPRVPGK